VRKAGFLSFTDHSISEDDTAPSGAYFYDRAVTRWLPVAREAVSYDGTRYAYSEGSFAPNTGGQLHVVGIVSGTDQTIYSGDTFYRVVEFAPDGIYLTLQVPEGRPRGLWLENPAGGAPRLISSTVIDPHFSGGVAWGEAFDATDPNPGLSGLARDDPGGPMNQLVRINLQTGATTPWYTWSGIQADIFLAGVDYSGIPFVAVAHSGLPTTEDLWRVTSQGHAELLFSGPSQQSWPFGLGAIDAQGIWFDDGPDQASSRAIWLYFGGVITIVATIANVSDVRVAGGCLATTQ
jgi:hypothetical protein